jgi:glycosyltransferase involved in cell wall biosynthesis
MIPTYNCASLLRICLASVLAQDLGPRQMEIVVIDDHSEHDDPAAVVSELGRDRVAFIAHDQNQGPIATFNDCVRHARGELVHILHGDDLVSDGFYEEVASLALTSPNSGLYATRFTFIDEDGRHTAESRPLVEGSVADTFADANPLQFCATVVRRSAFESTGGFTPNLVHTADFEMWVRLSARVGLATSPKVLASYREFDAQHSAGLRRTAGNLEDRERALAILERHGDLATTDRHLRQLRDSARHQASVFRERGEIEPERANLRYWSRRATSTERLRRQAGKLLRGRSNRRS